MNRSASMTVGRQVAIALALSVVVMLVVALIGVLALTRVADAKDEVIDENARIVIEAGHLEVAAVERSLAVRNLLITADQQYRTPIDTADAAYQQALSALGDMIGDAEGRRLLADIVDRKAELDAVAAAVIDERLAGTLPLEALGDAIRDRLTPQRRAVAAAVNALVEREEQLIDAAIEDSDETVASTTRLLVGLGLLGLVLAAGIGTWVTRNVSRRLTGLALNVDAAASEILAGTAQQAAGAAEQAAAVQETVATADELAQTAEQSANRARSVAEAAQRSSDVANEGATAIEEWSEAMVQINDQVEIIAATVLSLAERAQDISGIVRAVEDLADQIHLLALNAAIEAARAGEHGRGFSVVATEVRALADQSKRATTQITEILGEIQQGTNTAVMATEEGGKSVATGVHRSERTGSTIEQLAETVTSSAIAAEQISASSGQQAIATAQISDAMRDLDQTAQQNAAAARQAEQAARDLNEVAAGLKALVGAR